MILPSTSRWALVDSLQHGRSTPPCSTGKVNLLIGSSLTNGSFLLSQFEPIHLIDYKEAQRYEKAFPSLLRVLYHFTTSHGYFPNTRLECGKAQIVQIEPTFPPLCRFCRFTLRNIISPLVSLLSCQLQLPGVVHIYRQGSTYRCARCV